MSRFTVRRYESGDEEQILDLFNRVFADDNPDFQPRDMDTWRHIYLGNPQGHQTLVATDADGDIIANYSSCPVVIRVNGTERIATQVVDSCVDMKWRRVLSKKSLFITIAMEYQREFCDPEKPVYNDYIYGLPNENHYPLGVRLLGYTPVHCPLPRQVLRLDEQWPDELAQRAGEVTVEEAGWDRLDDVAALFARYESEMPLGNRRDAAYLAWRYRDWPGNPYRLLIASRGDRPFGAAIFRVGVPWEKQPIAAILDWFGSGRDIETAAALLSGVARAAWDAEHPRIETWVTPAMPLRASLRTLGMGEAPTTFNLCMVLFSPHYDIAWVKDSWFLTMGDTDIY